jgi:hypothetical protein
MAHWIRKVATFGISGVLYKSNFVIQICGIYFIPQKSVEKGSGITLENIWKRVIRYMR